MDGAYLDGSHAFVSEPYISVTLMFVRPADTGVSHFDEDLVWSYISNRRRLDNVSVLGPFEDCEVYHDQNKRMKNEVP